MSDLAPPSFSPARALRSADPEERRRAASMLGGLPLAQAIPLVMTALGDEDWRVRKEATFAARELLPADPLIGALVGALSSPDVGLCNAAVDVLGAAGAAATPHLSAAFDALGADGRKLAVEALGRTRDHAALAPLARALGSPDPNIRQTAAESIAALGSIAPDAVEELLASMLDDTDPIVRLSALSGLDQLGSKIPWEKLEPLLDDPALRPLALAAVARAGHAGAPAVLARALGASSGRAFEAALAAFAHVPLDPPPEEALAALRARQPALSDRLVAAVRGGGEEAAERRRTALLVGAALGEPRMIDAAIDVLGEPGLGDAAQAALERLGGPAAEALVARLERDGGAEDDLRALWVDALAELAPRSPAALRPTLGALRRAARGPSANAGPRAESGGAHAAARALHALGVLGEAEDLALAEAICLTARGAVAPAAEAALGALARRHTAAAHALWAGAEGEGSAGVARAAAVALGALADARALGAEEPRALRFLSQAATSDDARTRRAAAAALASVGGHAAAEALKFALADEEREVRRTAARGLGRLAAAGDNARLLGVVRTSGDPELLAAAVRAAGELLAADPGAGVVADEPSGPASARGATTSRPPASPRSAIPPASAHRLVAALAGLCEDPAPDVAIAALDALRRAPPDVPDRLEAMARALAHPDVDVVKTAVLKLATAIGEASGDGDAGPRSASGGARVPGGAWESLRSALDHERADMRLLVAEAICVIDPLRGREALVERARVERDPEVLATIDLALSAAQRQKKGAGSP